MQINDVVSGRTNLITPVLHRFTHALLNNLCILVCDVVGVSEPCAHPLMTRSRSPCEDALRGGRCYVHALLGNRVRIWRHVMRSRELAACQVARQTLAIFQKSIRRTRISEDV